MTWSGTPAYISLGSNVGDGRVMIRKALAELDKQGDVRVVRTSGNYRTAPWGLENQPDFVNAVAQLETRLEAGQLLGLLLATEKALGRKRDGVRWGPRSIDIDLLCYGQTVCADTQLRLPHPRMHLRAFVLVPLLELAPDFIIPGVGAARDSLKRLEPQRVERMA